HGSTVVGSQTVAGSQAAAELFPTLTTLAGCCRANDVAGDVIVGDSSFLLGSFPTFDRFGNHAFRFTPGGGIEDLGTTGDPSLFSAATGVNAAGLIVGYGDSADRSTIVALTWTGGVVAILPSLVDGGQAQAFAVNDAGDAVGQAVTSTGAFHAVFWPAGGGIQDIQSITGPESAAFDVNASQQVVGGVTIPGTIRGFLAQGGIATLLVPLTGDSQSL